MEAQELKNHITDNDIITLLNLMGSTIYFENEDVIISTTICHKEGKSPKLYFYKDSRFFHCYTDCGDSFDIIELVCRNKNLKFYDAIQWISIKLNINTDKIGFNHEEIEIIDDWKFINNFSHSHVSTKTAQCLDFYNKDILNIFQDMYCEDWINDGISINSMYKYEIKYSTLQQKIIIPHYDINYGLLGVRTRATIEAEIELYGKYSPFSLHSVMYSHPLSQNLYGLYKNKNTIMQKQKIMLVESEKAVLQCDTMFGDENFTVALCGKTLSNFQRDLILKLGVNEVIIGLDRQYQEIDSEEYMKFAKYIRDKIIAKLAPYVSVYVLWDKGNLLNYKDSPTDKGKETLLCLMKNKIYVGCYE